MIYISAKEIEELNEEKLKVFLQKQFRENRFLDYKLKYAKRSIDEAKGEFLADVTGFANYSGGNIIVGVEELEDEGTSSQPGELIGIDAGDKWAEQHRNLCDDSVDPPISGLIIKEIYLQSGKWAVVLHIPASLRRPHMITFRGKNRFYIRHDDRTVKMTVDEVRRSVVEVINIQKDLDTYISNVEEEIREDFIGDDFSLIMHSVPFLLEADQIDTSSEKIKSALQDSSLFINGMDITSHFSPLPNIHGIFGGISQTDPYYFTYIHRTGYVGLAYNIQNKLSFAGIKDKILSHSIKYVFLAFLRLSKLVIERTKTSSPYQISCVFVNSRQTTYTYQIMEFPEQSDIVWKRDRMKLPGIRLDSFQNIDEIAELFFERLRNAFGVS